MSVTTSFQTSVYQQLDSGSGEGGSEVVAYENGLLFVTNGASERVDIFNATSGALVATASAQSLPGFAGINSVAVSNGIVAVAVTRTTTNTSGVEVLDTGLVAFFNTSGVLLNTVEVGYGPDMVTFSPDGLKVFVANEGEPSEDGTSNPGSVSVIDLSNGVSLASESKIEFTQFDGQEDTLRAEGVRIFPDVSASDDFEPEYIAFSADGQTAYVTLQEANTVAKIDVASLSVTDLLPLGTVDYSLEGNGLDASDKDGTINITNWPVLGLRMPDAIATYSTEDGQTYFVTANEGDDRGENVRVADIVLDPTAFPDATTLQEDANLGRLNVSSIDGDTDGDGDYDVLYAYSTRSFSIFDDEGNLVFDSGDDFEQIIAAIRPEAFNIDDDTVEGRSDNKGPEAEAVAIGTIDDHTYAFIGLERDSGIMVYDITTPESSSFVTYINSTENGDLSPEVIKFIDAEDSVTGKPQLAIAYEVSGTTTLINIDQIGTQSTRTVFGTDNHASFVERLYESLFGRDGDEGGLGYWVAQMESGLSYSDAAEYFLQSEEASSVQGMSNETFVTWLYSNMLDTTASTSQAQYWESLLDQGGSRADLVAGFALSAGAAGILTSEGNQGISYELWVA